MNDELAHDIVAAAIQAPSVHNTQPWRFVAHEQGLQVWADRSRQLPVLDSSGRALHISCGAAVALAEVLVRSRGLACTVVLRPDPANPDRLADLEIGGTAEATDVELAAVIPSRHTERRPFEPTPVPPDVVRLLAVAAERAGCWLKVVDDVEGAATVIVTLARAEELLVADPAYLAELSSWTGRPADGGDGLPASVLSGPAPGTRGSSFRLRDFDPAGDSRATSPPPDPPVAEHPLVVVLGTDADDPDAWLRAGRALGRVLLTATAHGLASSPMTQALEVEDTRARLTRDLGLLGHPQMVLRVGFPVAAPDPGPARRRAVQDVLTRG